jgi:hypothetical protein
MHPYYCITNTLSIKTFDKEQFVAFKIIQLRFGDGEPDMVSEVHTEGFVSLDVREIKAGGLNYVGCRGPGILGKKKTVVFKIYR